MIAVMGMTCVFVPQDLTYMNVDVAELHRLNRRLVPLIAHDRAGFGGALACLGLLILGCVWRAEPSRSLRQVLLLSGLGVFVPAIAIHFVVGYDDPLHLAPAIGAAGMYAIGWLMIPRRQHRCAVTEKPLIPQRGIQTQIHVSGQ